MADEKVQTFDIPKTCKGGVVINEGPDFHVEVQDVEVPEPGTSTTRRRMKTQTDCIAQVQPTSSLSSTQPAFAIPICTTC
jgi:hypothetical protein